MRPCSTSATVSPRPLTRPATFSPVLPAPITTTSYVSMRDLTSMCSKRSYPDAAHDRVDQRNVVTESSAPVQDAGGTPVRTPFVTYPQFEADWSRSTDEVPS